MSNDFGKAQEMVVASMEYVKVLGFRIRKTEEISETWKKAAQTHAEECVKLREQLHHLRTAAESGMLPQIVKERDALRAECDRLAKSFDKQRERIRELVNQNQRLTAELAANSAEIERLKKPARQHPVKAGEWVWVHEHRRANQVQEVHADWYWLSTCDSCRFDRCTPFDPPEATHDTPAGKDAAESAVKREPKPGDKVRLVREPSHTDIPAMLPWSKAFGMPGDTAIVVIMAVPDKVPSGTIPVRTGMGRCFFWPISCIEIVEDAPARQHPVKVGEWVERTSGEYSPGTKIGAIAQVIGIDEDGDYEVSIDGTKRCWSPKCCSPCDPPESTHDTPEGKQAAESVIRDDRKTAPDEIKVGDVVRATFWKAGQAAVVKEILADGRLILDCSDQPWRVDEVVKLMRKVTT